MAREINRIVNFLIGYVSKDRRTEESLGINLGFQDVENRQSLDRQYTWDEFDGLFTQIEEGVTKLRANPKVVIQGRKERALMRIFMPSTRKDEENCWYCLYLPDAERLLTRMNFLKSQKPALVPAVTGPAEDTPLTEADEEVLRQIENDKEASRAIIDRIVEEEWAKEVDNGGQDRPEAGRSEADQNGG